MPWRFLDIERTLANAINFSEAVDGPGFDVAVFDLSAAQGDQLVHAISADPGAPAPTRQALQSGSPFWGRNLGWRQDLAGNIHTVRA